MKPTGKNLFGFQNQLTQWQFEQNWVESINNRFQILYFRHFTNRFTAGFVSSFNYSKIHLNASSLSTSSQWTKNGLKPNLFNGEPYQTFSSINTSHSLGLFCNLDTEKFGTYFLIDNGSLKYRILNIGIKSNSHYHPFVFLSTYTTSKRGNIISKALFGIEKEINNHYLNDKNLSDYGLSFELTNIKKSVAIQAGNKKYQFGVTLTHNRYWRNTLNYQAYFQIKLGKSADETTIQNNFLQRYYQSEEKFSKSPTSEDTTSLLIPKSKRLHVILNFKFNEWKLDNSDKELLKPVLEELQNQTALKVIIIGHSDQVGSQKAKNNISGKRANSVAKYFIAKGIEEERISTLLASDHYPLVKEVDEFNRRIEFIIY